MHFLENKKLLFVTVIAIIVYAAQPFVILSLFYEGQYGSRPVWGFNLLILLARIIILTYVFYLFAKWILSSKKKDNKNSKYGFLQWLSDAALFAVSIIFMQLSSALVSAINEELFSFDPCGIYKNSPAFLFSCNAVVFDFIELVFAVIMIFLISTPVKLLLGVKRKLSTINS